MNFNIYIKQNTFKILSLLVVFVFLKSCAPISFVAPADRIFEENRSSVVFEPENYQIQLMGNVELIVEPVEPAYLNMVTYMSAVQTGDTERLNFREIRNLQNFGSLSRDEQRRLEQLINVSDLLNENYNELFSDQIIDDILVQHAIQLGITNLPGSSSATTSERDYPNSYNPFFVNNRFLSVIKLTFKNNGSQVKRYRSNQLNVVFQGNTFSPHNNDYFTERLTNPLQIDNVFNFNMPEELVVAPSQSVTRYIGVQPLPNSIERFTVQYIDEEEFSSADFEVKRVTERVEYTFKGFILNDRAQLPQSYRLLDDNYILINNGVVSPIEEMVFYLNQDTVSAESRICGFYHHNSRTASFSGQNNAGITDTRPRVHCFAVNLNESEDQVIVIPYTRN